MAVWCVVHKLELNILPSIPGCPSAWQQAHSKGCGRGHTYRSSPLLVRHRYETLSCVTNSDMHFVSSSRYHWETCQRGNRIKNIRSTSPLCTTTGFLAFRTYIKMKSPVDDNLSNILQPRPLTSMIFMETMKLKEHRCLYM